MNKHIFWMIIGCGIPLLLIFIAPVFGISDNISLFIFILVMFACHLLMPMHHHGKKKHKSSNENQSKFYKTETHESH